MLKTGRGAGEKQRARKRAAVAASIERSPTKLKRKRSSELDVLRSTVRDHMKKHLNVRPYRPTVGMATWFGAMNHAVLCWTHSQMPYSAQRFFQ